MGIVVDSLSDVYNSSYTQSKMSRLLLLKPIFVGGGGVGEEGKAERC